MKKKVAIMIPTKGTMKTRTTECLLRTFTVMINNKIDFRAVFSEGTLLTHVRNALMESALREENITHLLFMDSDMIFDPQWIVDMINLDLDFVTGLARCRGRKQLNLMKYVPSEGMYDTFKDEEIKERLVEIDAVGMAFFLMKKEAVLKVQENKKVIQEYFLTKSNEVSSPLLKKQYKTLGKDEGFFRAIGKKSEDILFCEDIKTLGFKIWAYTPAKLGHIVEETLDV